MSSLIEKTNEFGSYTLQYLPMVESITRKLHNRFRRQHDYEDMRSEAIIAALQAEKKYDPTKAKFGMFIRKYVEGAIIRSITTVTNRQHVNLAKIYGYINKYLTEHDKVPSLNMVLDELGIDKEAYDKAMVSTHVIQVPYDDVAHERFDGDTEDLYDAVNRLSDPYRDAVISMLEDRSYSKSRYRSAIKQLKEMLND